MKNKQGKTSEYIFTSPNYVHTMIEYSGEFQGNIKDVESVYITLINNEYAIVSIASDIIVKDNKLNNFNDINYIRSIVEEYVDSSSFNIIYIVQPQLYTLQEISAVDVAQVNLLQANISLNLSGNGVIVGIVDTGIDYLSEEFRDKNGKSRIISIWDQTIRGDDDNTIIPFGSLYTREEINKAIDVYEAGGNPYDIVPSKDTNGHGTGMAGIVGALGKNKDIKGIAPECEFVIVKLSEANYTKKILNTETPIFSLVTVFSAIEYLKRVLFKEKKPLVILLPLGSNNGNHKGDNIFNSFIESISSNVGIVIVTGSGNEANKDGHVSGVIIDKENIEVIDLLVQENQRYMAIEIWVELPSIIDINLISPSGEETGFIQGSINVQKVNTFIFEKTQTKISYYLPEEYTGEELITIVFADIAPGVWQIKLRLRSGEMARYNAWLWQSGIALPGTRFLPSDQYGTVTTPGDSDFVVTVAAYNQNNNNSLSYSGVSFREENINKIDLSAGGVNTITVGLNNSTQVINGTSLAAAIGAGACILLFQWGIVQGNYPYMYSQSIKTFLRRGVNKRGKDIYPNPQWGYGIINFYKIFEEMI
ncbi:S8 family peptidase [Clostridium sp.]|uniref:S8 family peptidase n=1 Tax=Clostridium sp. TaxID=1506 RepID=UPI0025ED1327|nr:S8 family peptidase [uncultured Clostridium sp.]MDU4882469.1 S8 family peptidase [Clostridium celatum]MDU7075825.1 S8 family peptidase [Clostridium celatum]